MALIPHLISITPNEHGVLIFHTWKNKIPEGVQILSAGGGAPTTSARPAVAGTSPDVTLKNARLGFDSFLEQLSIKSVIVSERPDGYCLIYVNWEVNPALPGYNTWGGGVYQAFLRSLFTGTFKRVKVRRQDKKISVTFSAEPANGSVETKVIFVAEKQVVAKGSQTLHLPKKS